MIPTTIQTVIDQLGGQQIFSMAFERCTYSVRGDDSQRPPSKGPASVSFAIAHDLRRTVKATHVVIELEDDDTYTVNLWKVMNGIGFKQTIVKSLALVHADQLRAVVEDMTGLHMTLGTMGR